MTSTHNPSILLKRILNLVEPTPLLLIKDNINHNGQTILNEILISIASSHEVIFVSFETLNKPKFADKFICMDNFNQINRLPELVKTHTTSAKKTVIIIDSLNYISSNDITGIIAELSRSGNIIGIYHEDIPEKYNDDNEYYPSINGLLDFMSNIIIEMELPDEEEILENNYKFNINKNMNQFNENKIKLTYRRKSGRSLEYNFHINYLKHDYTFISEDQQDTNTVETPEMLQGLTTFNLSTSDKQKKAKEQVDLPFLEAQQFTTGGAIVYEFEKDDDYDEEDPFEDPF
ncbi:hypothetical protein TBLA_0C06710 [Henningerozyma blattae CBS 6284]|uniref:Elongator complex protein 5 n=1 Tax=Henningerozyma blattae (strain ATCC 34711 / CBS 6284 / DSM 70876 / NBRC 10599 / NRRL Y-10934 / UCD 77-7) TaxID=1071380 RepID=I2H261_HENB6|nr:hypothetical protein TBLA_0C06710 [Tetrapisispora blattae CBS 6284]CCH60463.1 hypothetical protein TBLA_0C06710 [Tetrapisispora blattae CBS 6284]